jgi:hypothetical protein
VKEYLRGKMRMHRWVQFPIEQAIRHGLDVKSGFHYISETSENFIEFHVDANDVSKKFGNCMKFGENLSVRFPEDEKILLSFGHDEVIFNKNAFSDKCWSGPGGERPLVPKEDGTGVMVSGIQSREFGFGFREITAEELSEINKERAGKCYADENAAYKVLGSKLKDVLMEGDNPFIRYFQFGANNEGYWSYEHLIVQMEDCVDVLRGVLDFKKYEIRFMVDHSCGHDRQRDDGLNVIHMNKDYGGKQRMMHHTKITEDILGPHHPLLQSNEVQYMSYRTSDEGPFDMDPEERKILKDQDLVGSKFVMKGRKELIKDIYSSGCIPIGINNMKIGAKTIVFNRSKQEIYESGTISTSIPVIRQICRKYDICWRKQVHCHSQEVWKDKTRIELLKDLNQGNHVIDKTKTKKPDLVEKATQYGIPLKRRGMSGVSEKWVSKPKGKLQIARERGLLDLEKYVIEDFSDKGRVDVFGNRIRETSLDQLLSQCSDFLREESLLQLNIRKLGCTCVHSPQFHCEIAGEGIEYSWGNAKMKYRSFRAADKRSKAQFLEKVRYCMSREFLTNERVRKNSRRSREYMVSYFILSSEASGNLPYNEFARLSELKPCSISASKIEQMKEKVRTHRAALDFDRNFCEVKFKVEKDNNL